jgi:hypothetical protein
MPFCGRRDDAIDIEGQGSGISVNANLVSPDVFPNSGYSFAARDASLQTKMSALDNHRRSSPQAMANRFWSDADPDRKTVSGTGDGNSARDYWVVSDFSSTHVGKVDGPLFYTPTHSIDSSGAQLCLANRWN